MDLPGDWKEFQVPPALNQRLQSLLDKQDSGIELSGDERGEAKAITELVDMLSLMKLRAERAKRSMGR